VETTCAGSSGVRFAGPGSISQVKESLGRFPQFVFLVAAVAAVLAPPVMIPVLVADLAQMSQRRVQVIPELQLARQPAGAFRSGLPGGVHSGGRLIATAT
jgi:hypothetical protein